MPAVDTPAFLRDLYELRGIGTFKTGVHRPTYSPQDMEARRWLMAKLTACGLEASIDGIGNAADTDGYWKAADLERRRNSSWAAARLSKPLAA